MKALVWLTILQMAAARAVPKPQEDCIEPTLSSGNNVDMALAATSTAAPELTVAAELSATAGVVVSTTLVDETRSGVVFVPYPLDPVPTAIQIVSATRDEAASSSTLPSHGGIFFDTVPTSSAFVSVDVVMSAATETVSADCDEVPLTSTSPSQGGIVFDPVSTSLVSVSVPVVTTSASSGTAQILPSLSTQIPQTTGVVVTSLNTPGLPTSAPIISTSISKPETTLTPTAPATSVTTTVSQGSTSDNIFQPVATDAPASVIGSRPDHPVPRLGIQPQDAPIGTNKFYANFFLGSQTSGTWTHPYSVAWSKGGGSSQSWGMSIQHTDANQRVYGPDPAAVPAQYMINPVGIQSLVLSALELGASTVLTTDTLTAFSANVNLSPSAGASPAITFPLVQGMGFVTGIYNGCTPVLQSGIFFRSVTKATANPKPGVTKYTILLEDGKTWLLYASSSDVNAALDFTVVNNGLAQATSNFNGFIQIAKNPGGDAEALYDAACGVYATTATLSGTANGASGSYTLSFAKVGTSGATLLMFALPHHIESFSPQTASAATDLQLQTTTKGLATAVVADSWNMVEDLPTTMGFAPWSPSAAAQPLAFSLATIQTILSVAQSEISENMSDQTNLSSMYFSGKALAKFAGIVYTVHDLLGGTALAQAGLTNLKQAFALFASNQQQFPLVHETAWGGVVSTASYTTGQSGADFGNTYYNDHHFHYGYFIYAASIIGALDPTWLPDNQAWVNTLVRDIANPSTTDNFFPVSRMFDWYHGHSWAHGLYETADGKDEESSSEDAMSAYALKLWGRTIGDANLEARGNLQLAITARSLQNYFLYTSDNTIEPGKITPNKVSGILFENKIDHTTYFGTNIEYIQGIHMLPLLPASTLTRTPTFVQQEWDTYFSNGRADAVAGGWRGVLYANYAIVNPSAAWNFFASSTFDASWLDGGASRTWYLAFAAGLGGAP